ncbi:MAG TPA: hypothetical protein VF596_11425 [Pyrinomonadaceae bacterium]|jgi:hypothetical protein
MTIRKLFTFLFIFAIFGVAGAQSSYAHGAEHNHKHIAFNSSDATASKQNIVVSHSQAFHNSKIAKTKKVKYKLVNGKRIRVMNTEEGGWTCWACSCVWGVTHNGIIMNSCEPQAEMEDCKNHRGVWCSQYATPGTKGGS